MMDKNEFPTARRFGEILDHLRELLASFDEQGVDGNKTGEPGEAPEPTPAQLRELARSLHAVRLMRAEHFDAALFGEPAWDMLLELYAVGERPLQVKAVCLAANVPYATAWRWLKILDEKGLVVRSEDCEDARSVEVRLSPLGQARMREFLRRHPMAGTIRAA